MGPIAVAGISHSNNETTFGKEEDKKGASAEDEESKMPSKGSIDEGPAAAGAPAVPKPLGPKLTESQLYDLYQRLDINGQYLLDLLN